MDYDFSGYATRNDIKCSDGRTIRHNAFIDCDGKKVPLVWMHQHNTPSTVLGHALLENRPDGVYCYCKLNDTDNGKNAKIMVGNGDVESLSIYANQLKHYGSDVLHGNIREVSLVLAGANPGAFIDTVNIAHADGEDEEAFIYSGEFICHGNGYGGNKMDERTVQDVVDSMTDEQQDVLNYLVGIAANSADEEIEHDAFDDGYEAGIADGYDDGYDDAYDDGIEDGYDNGYDDGYDDAYDGDYDYEDNYDDEYYDEGDDMKHNVFENDYDYYEASAADDFMAHADMEAIFDDAQKCGSLKDSVLAHAGDYGIDHIDYLFPDAKMLGDAPDFIKRPDAWVSKVMGSVHHTPFSRIKSMHADITADEARAKGYTKGKKKIEEVFTLLKRTTDPTTVYKKQKLDRDDIVDITDFNVVSWLKTEMRMMLDEELARAILIGDGRDSLAEDKIGETHIRPIATDDELYTIKAQVKVGQEATLADEVREFIRTAIKARKDYRGTGMPTLYTTEDILTEMLLLTDKDGRDLYDSVDKLATKLRVKEIVTVPVMEKFQIEDTGKKPVMGIIVNLSDYNVGADKGGAVNMFDDFDIDYNQKKYLIETRCSGALTKPKSAIVVDLNKGALAAAASTTEHKA